MKITFQIVWICWCVLWMVYMSFKFGRLSGFSWCHKILISEWHKDTTLEMFQLDHNRATTKSEVYESMSNRLRTFYDLPFFHWRNK